MISILLPDLRGGGVERTRIVLAHEFARAGHEVEFVLMQARGELLSEAEEKFAIHNLNCERTRQVPLKLMRYLRQKRPEALLAAMWPFTGIASLAVSLSRQSVRLVSSEHVDFRQAASHKLFEKWALKYLGRIIYAPCHSIVAVSNGVAESLTAVAGLSQDQMQVINNPVRPFTAGEITKDDSRNLAGWLEGQVRLIAIGSLIPAKGFDVLLRAFSELRQSVDAQLLILGKGPQRNELESLLADLGLSENVYLPGFRSNPGPFLRHAHVFVLSSNWEGFGNVIIEALSVGLPVVSTDCQSGPAEILEHGKYGTLVPVDSPHELAKAVEKTLTQSRNRKFLVDRAAEFSPHKAAQAYLELLT